VHYSKRKPKIKHLSWKILLREGEISVKDLPKRIKSLSRVKTRVGASGTAWIKAHKDRFVIQDGMIRLKNRPSQGSRPPPDEFPVPPNNEEMGPQIPPAAMKPKPVPKAIAKTKKTKHYQGSSSRQ
jgi:hypothetical protein